MLRNKVPTLAPLLLFALLPACGQTVTKGDGASSLKQGWDNNNNPLQLGSGYERHFDQLALSGGVRQLPWSDTYWPSFQGGIARRWNVDQPYAFSFNPPSENQVRSMSDYDMAALSPAEKFDIYTGRFDYPIFNYERRVTNPDRPTWEGICHGWAPAAINYDEPRPVLARGPSGIAVPFGSDDIKALLDLYSGNFAGANSHQLASRCDIDLTRHPEAANLPNCRGVNAGSFQIILSNFLGIRQKAFIANVYRFGQIWNQPVYGFSTKVFGRHGPTRGAAPGTTQEVEVETTMNYVAEINPVWQAVAPNAGEIVKAATYRYRVELNQGGEIIGGAWEQDERPGFLWTSDRTEFSGQFAKLADLYAASLSADGSYGNPRAPR